jgi:hypothetical protein
MINGCIICSGDPGTIYKKTRFVIQRHAIIPSNKFYKGEVVMAGFGKADKGRKQQKKKPQHTLKEKRKLKEEKKNKTSTGL